MPTQWTPELVELAYSLGALGIPDLRYSYKSGSGLPNHWPGCPVLDKGSAVVPSSLVSQEFDAIAFDTSQHIDDFALPRSTLITYDFLYPDLARLHALSALLWLVIERMSRIEIEMNNFRPFWSLVPSSFPSAAAISPPMPRHEQRLHGIFPTSAEVDDDETAWIAHYLKDPPRVPHKPNERNGPLTSVGRMRALSHELKRSIRAISTTHDEPLRMLPNIIGLCTHLHEDTFGLQAGIDLLLLHSTLLHIERQRQELAEIPTEQALSPNELLVLTHLRKHPQGLDGYELAGLVFGPEEVGSDKRSATNRLSKVILGLRKMGFYIDTRPYKLIKEPNQRLQ